MSAHPQLLRYLLFLVAATNVLWVGLQQTLAVSGTLDFGVPTAVAVNTSGETATFTFSGTLGQRVSFGVTSVALTPSQGTSAASIKIYKPDGSLLSTKSFGDSGADFDVNPLPATGTTPGLR